MKLLHYKLADWWGADFNKTDLIRRERSLVIYLSCLGLASMNRQTSPLNVHIQSKRMNLTIIILSYNVQKRKFWIGCIRSSQEYWQQCEVRFIAKINETNLFT